MHTNQQRPVNFREIDWEENHSGVGKRSVFPGTSCAGITLYDLWNKWLSSQDSPVALLLQTP